ncbi:unnamed protein product [Brassica oleracea var. botrytis]|uniref:Uncharacterized protein n=2 Tax=Brassica TaxID=3705 RepID=A0A3P6G9J4_BRAOL|nr:unnamed protein product [Brassica napus]CDY34575.1 BnaC03g56750D [Brassica napus]VDD55994.1 unnamed protein product [Brassica oleracea]
MSTSKKWNDAMIGRYYSVLGRVPDKDNIKEIAKCLKARSEILNNIGKKKKKKVSK